jgi:hypothetical protein
VQTLVKLVKNTDYIRGIPVMNKMKHAVQIGQSGAWDDVSESRGIKANEIEICLLQFVRIYFNAFLLQSFECC